MTAPEPWVCRPCRSGDCSECPMFSGGLGSEPVACACSECNDLDAADLFDLREAGEVNRGPF